MSGYVTGWVLKHSPVQDLGELMVLVVLSDCAHDDGAGSFPSVGTIADRSRQSPRKVQYALRNLEAGGHITKLGTTKHGTSVWRVETQPGGAHDVHTPNGGAHVRAPEPSLSANQAISSGDGSSGARRAPPPTAEDQQGWARAHELLRDRHPDTTYHLWLAGLGLAGVNGRSIAVAAPDHSYALIRDRYLPGVRQAAVDAFGRDLAVDLIPAREAPPAGQLAGKTGRGPGQDRVHPDATLRTRDQQGGPDARTAP